MFGVESTQSRRSREGQAYLDVSLSRLELLLELSSVTLLSCKRESLSQGNKGVRKTLPLTVSAMEDECWDRCCSVRSAFLIRLGLVHVDESNHYFFFLPTLSHRSDQRACRRLVS